MKSENLPYILPEYIIEAAAKLDKVDLETLNKATKHHVIVNGKSYPPKELLKELIKLIQTRKLDIDLGTTTGGAATNLVFENAGFEVVAFKVVIPPLKDIPLLIHNYKKLIAEDNNDGEIYKWEAVKQFQTHWDLRNRDFGSMLKQSFGKRQNLMYQVSSWFLDILADEYPDEARKMFEMLYEEGLELYDRIKEFQARSDEIIADVSAKRGKKLHHQQDERAISFYLALCYPEKHIIYMNDVYTRLCLYLDVKPLPAGKKYQHFLALTKSIKPEIRNDDELQQLVKTTLTSSSWQNGDQSNLITQDILYRILKQTPEMLIDASDQKEVFDIINPDKTKSSMNLNTILYGPPGTGKTYHTINKALEILGENIKGKSRSEIKDIYDQKVIDGQIVFTTFHQSMSYEDFVEGIKPETLNGRINYMVKPGIFKNICSTAQLKNQTKGIEFNEAYEKFIAHHPKNVRLELKTKNGNPFSLSINSNGNLNIHTGPEGKKNGDLVKERIIEQINGGKQYYTGHIAYLNPFLDYLQEEYDYNKIETQNFVLIIDEINRGNVSQILGELITLIEEDKREGNEEAISVILPYSKENFSVPSNLYIVGTMNTADRSVEAIDTALRRRFKFEEIRPNPILLEPYAVLCRFSKKYWLISWEDWKKQYRIKAVEFYKLLGISNVEIASNEDKSYYDLIEKNNFDPTKCMAELINVGLTLDPLVDISLLISTINKRIEILKDRDHQIGHSYFMNIESIEDLIHVFKESIIPLLQEYFFGDYKKIQLVLGEEFIVKTPSKVKFAVDDDGEFEDKIIYSINSKAFNSEADFIDALTAMKI